MPQYYLPPSDAKNHVTVTADPDNFCGFYACVNVGKQFVSVKMGDYSSSRCAFGLKQSCVNSISASKIFNEVNRFFQLRHRDATVD